MFSRRYAFAMISIGIAVSSRIGPLPYAVAAASAASDSPTVAAGADEAMPMTVSWATPIALGSRRAAGWGGIPTIAVAGWSVIRLSSRAGPEGLRMLRAARRLPRPLPGHRAIITIISGMRGYVPGSNVREFPGGRDFLKDHSAPRDRRGQFRQSGNLTRERNRPVEGAAPAAGPAAGGIPAPAGSRIVQAKVVSFACRRCLVTRDSGGTFPPRPHPMDHSWPGTRAAVVTHVRQVARGSCTSWPGATCSGATGTSPTRCG